MKYNPNICMKIMINVMRIDMKMVQYDEDASGVVLVIIKMKKY